MEQFGEGWAAYEDGVLEQSDNPYTPGTAEYWAWNEGWEGAAEMETATNWDADFEDFDETVASLYFAY